jgi:hypothetical protein
MGWARLNVWIRDENCKVLKNAVSDPMLDWVGVYDCMGNEIAKATIPAGDAHLEIAVPPGCYIVKGHICQWPEGKINNSTDRVMVMACCGDVLCVDLIVPVVRTCVLRDLHPFVRDAMQLVLATPATSRPSITRDQVVTTARVILKASNVQPREALEMLSKMVKGAGAQAKEFENTLSILNTVVDMP